MLNTIPFNTKFTSEIRQGTIKVITKGGNPVEIIKWDVRGPFPIVGLVNTEDFQQIAVSYNCQGKTISDKESELDLVLIDPLLEDNPERDNEIIKGIIEYLECYNDFDCGGEDFDEYCKRFEEYIRFMKVLPERLNKL